MDEQRKEIESLKTELSSLKIRLKRIEEYLAFFQYSKTYIGDEDSRDALFKESVKIVVKYDKVAASLLQRKLTIGYSRAARIMDQLEAAGIVGSAEGAKPRDVLCRNEELIDYE